jgi:hypothetical protein
MDGQIIDLHKQSDEVFDVRISVSKELADHYNKIIERRDDILANPESEDKAIIGILNATTGIIRDLAKIQADLYNSERFATLQQIIVNCLREVSPDLQEKVLEEFERKYEEIV